MSKKNYPAQTGEYKVKVKTNQSTHSWADFIKARCQISVGQDYHERSKLSAMLNWCADRFNTVTVCVNDTLQRYTTMFEENISEASAFDVAMQKGTEWIERNEGIWCKKSNISVVRWEDWKNGDYSEIKPKVAFMYASNPEFEQAINKNIMEIWDRRRKIKPELYKSEHFDRFFELSKQYLLEEISAFSIMYERDKAIDIYPGTTIFAATLFQGREVKGAPSGLGKGHFCRVDFSRNKNNQSNDNDIDHAQYG
jgi:tRNA-dependent cyclodipeptide synthase